MGSFVAVRPNYSFHVVSVNDDGRVREISDVTKSDIWINGGYFVMRSEVLDDLRPGEELVEEPFQRLIAAQSTARPPSRRLLGADGHAQGEAVAREPARERPGAVGAVDDPPRGRRGACLS